MKKRTIRKSSVFNYVREVNKDTHIKTFFKCSLSILNIEFYGRSTGP